MDNRYFNRGIVGFGIIALFYFIFIGSMSNFVKFLVIYTILGLIARYLWVRLNTKQMEGFSLFTRSSTSLGWNIGFYLVTISIPIFITGYFTFGLLPPKYLSFLPNLPIELALIVGAVMILINYYGRRK